MITEEQADKRRLDKLDAPQRIKWLREKCSCGYIRDLALRHHMKLPTTTCAGVEVVPVNEAKEVFNGFGYPVGLTPDEVGAAFSAEWDSVIALAKKVDDKLRVVALGHIKTTGQHDGLPLALQAAVNNFPTDWPFLAEHDIERIASKYTPEPRRGQARRKPLNLGVRTPMT